MDLYSRIPSFLDSPINASERGDFEQHSAEALDQRPQTGLWHHWYKFIEHDALTKQLQPFWQRVRARAGLKDVRIHDLRHTFASTAVASGQGLPMIGKLLGHAQVQSPGGSAGVHRSADY